MKLAYFYDDLSEQLQCEVRWMFNDAAPNQEYLYLVMLNSVVRRIGLNQGCDLSNILHAFSVAKEAPWLWFRPVSWRATGSALCVENCKIRQVPDPKGGRDYMPCNINELMDAWELVSPDTVNAEADFM